MRQISVIGLDLAKNVFQIHAIDKQGKLVSNRQLKRSEMIGYFSNLPSCLIGMEACGGAHYWQRKLSEFGHVVKIMAASFVKPYVKSNKNDHNDAEAICEAVQRPSMRFVSPKTPDQQSVLHLHRGRQLLVQQRVALVNHIRSILLEYGIAIAVGDKALQREFPWILEDAENELPMLTRQMLSELWEEQKQLRERALQLKSQLQGWHKQNQSSQNLETIPGVGLLTATALAATVKDCRDFKNGRQLAAYLGLVPRQSSSGGKQVLLGISKRGDGYLRTLLIHGARTVIRHVRRRLSAGQAGGNLWVEKLLKRCHPNEVAVALANKMARIAWAMLSRNETYRISLASV